MAELTGKPGFAPRTKKTQSKRRAATIELIAMFSLTVALVIAATAVSLGNRSLARGETMERQTIQAPIGALIDQTGGWLPLRVEQ